MRLRCVNGSTWATMTSVRVQKFRSVTEMNAAPVVSRHRSAAIAFDEFLRHCARYWRISPRVYPRGVFKFRTIEEAQRARSRAGAAAPDHRP